jgi:hypothetical protein
LNSTGAIIRAYIMYKPYVIFTFFAGLFGLLGLIPFIRWGILQIVDSTPGGHLQSLLLGAVLLIIAFLSVIIGIISDLIRTNRILIEDTLEHTKKMRFGKGEYSPSSTPDDLASLERFPVAAETRGRRPQDAPRR